MDILKWKGKFSQGILQDKELQANNNPGKRIRLAGCPIQRGKPWKYLHKTRGTDSNICIHTK